MIERIIQRCDYSESISNKHRTTNGYIQVKELLKLCELTVRRPQTLKTLTTILNESKDNSVPQNIVNDPIIKSYFQDLLHFVKSYQEKKLQAEKRNVNYSELKSLQHNLQVFAYQLDNYYYSSLVKELSEINYENSEDFERNAIQISSLIDLLIPYLLFHGYSIASLNQILIEWVEQEYRPTIQRILKNFDKTPRMFAFLLYVGERNHESVDFVQLLRAESKSKVQEFSARDVNVTSVGSDVLKGDELFVFYKMKAIDPNNHIRQTYDNLIKRVVIKKDRQSLNSFNNFFTRSFWTFGDDAKSKFRVFKLNGDPINVAFRTHTLQDTLSRTSRYFEFGYSKGNELPRIETPQLLNSLYFYNLAIGSKSIENSLSLLWTALESMLPYRLHGNDIECVQHFISTAMSISATARNLQGFANRAIWSCKVNGVDVKDVFPCSEENLYSPQGLISWYQDIVNPEVSAERTITLSTISELLAYEYCQLGRKLSGEKLKYLRDRAETSKKSTEYQLQRIYLHRNQIVHSGELINEYTNLWSHLEWYVGKMLAHYLIDVEITKNSKSLDESYRKIEADYNYLTSYLDLNKEKKITDLSPRILEILFKYVQFSF